MNTVSSALEYWPSPPPWGWKADDLDHLPAEGPNGEPDFFKHVELIDGALVFMSPQKRFHQRMIRRLTAALDGQAPESLSAVDQMDVKLGHRTRPCPDIVVIDTVAADDDERTFYTPDEVRLVVEIVSPESEDRDRKTKPFRYAEAGIRHFWRVENNDGKAVVYVYELDPATGAYGLTGIHHGHLTVPVPFPIDIDLG
ncbi:Uma2 family endonuclease [Streptosporangium saharense]|uniref:Uma2 family endonuclease n=1 Tax=Streptosporangium saharense TaxID=1706840 RepID=UPI0036888E97